MIGGTGMIIDIFAGPGGWDEGLLTLGRSDVIGIEWEKYACATARAAGHRRAQADVSKLDPTRLRGQRRRGPYRLAPMPGVEYGR